ncbi:hypothetical protein HispidOSU_028614 [Sigmodon hispidus]
MAAGGSHDVSGREGAKDHRTRSDRTKLDSFRENQRIPSSSPVCRLLNLVPLMLQELRLQATMAKPQTQHPADPDSASSRPRLLSIQQTQTQHPADTVAEMNSVDSTGSKQLSR